MPREAIPVKEDPLKRYMAGYQPEPTPVTASVESEVRLAPRGIAPRTIVDAIAASIKRSADAGSFSDLKAGLSLRDVEQRVAQEVQAALQRVEEERKRNSAPNGGVEETAEKSNGILRGPITRVQANFCFVHVTNGSGKGGKSYFVPRERYNGVRPEAGMNVEVRFLDEKPRDGDSPVAEIVRVVN